MPQHVNLLYLARAQHSMSQILMISTPRICEHSLAADMNQSHSGVLHMNWENNSIRHDINLRRRAIRKLLKCVLFLSKNSTAHVEQGYC